MRCDAHYFDYITPEFLEDLKAGIISLNSKNQFDNYWMGLYYFKPIDNDKFIFRYIF